MPNWIEGTMKLRGDINNIKDFFLSGISLYRFDYDTSEDVEIERSKWFELEDYPDYWEINLKGEPWINGTHRAFIKQSQISYYGSTSNNAAVIAFDIRAAWYFRPDNFIEIAKTYNLDIKLYGVESGMEFIQEVEIDRKGTLLYDREKEFDNWVWDCPFPDLGG